jgi:hypothetical protein
MFDFVMKMFSEGDALPALGMEEIPRQLANQLIRGFFCQYKSS